MFAVRATEPATSRLTAIQGRADGGLRTALVILAVGKEQLIR